MDAITERTDSAALAHRNVVVLGLPGAGKGTQGRRLSKTSTHLSIGELLRSRGTPENARGRVADAGAIRDLLFAALTPGETNWVIDGVRRRSTAEMLNEILRPACVDVAVKLTVSIGTARARLIARTHCPSCKTAYGLAREPVVSGACDRCAVPLVRRSDDVPEIIERRLADYLAFELEVESYYRDCGRLVDVDGEGSPDRVWRDVRTALG